MAVFEDDQRSENHQEWQPLLSRNKPLHENHHDIQRDGEEASPTPLTPAFPSSRPPPIVYVIAGCAALNTCNVGFDIGVNSPAGMLLQLDLDWQDWELEIFMGAINLFALFGALWSAHVIRRYGMKVAFYLSSGLFLVGILLMVSTTTSNANSKDSGTATTTNTLPLWMGRILVGLGIGFGFAVTPQYIAEISPKSHRGCLVSWSEIGCNVGILLGFFMGFIFADKPPHQGWRWMFGMGCILPVVMILLTRTVLVESPRWLVTQGRHEECLQVLEILNKDQQLHRRQQAQVERTDNIGKPPKVANYNSNEEEEDEDSSLQMIQRILQDIQKDIEQEQQQQQQVLQQSNAATSTTTNSRLGSSLAWLLFHKKTPIVQKMLYTAFGVAISHEICGIDAIQYYLVFILEAAGINSRQERAKFLVALGFLKLLCLFIAMVFVDSIGRRPLLLISVGGMIVSLLTIAGNFYFFGSSMDENRGGDVVHNGDADDGLRGTATSKLTMYLSVGGLAMYLAFFSVGLGPLGWVLPPELTSTTIRAKVVSLATFANRMTATIMTSTMLSIASWLSWGGYFLLLAGINSAIWILAYRYLPETKGKKLEDTSAYFQ